MKNIILVAGATGSLGEKICRELQTRGANVRALIRPESNPEKTEALKEAGIETLVVDFSNSSQLVAACSGVSCIVSALAGLKETIVEVQTQLLDAAAEAGVPRFIPSDFCTDYTQLPEGSNRNFDLRKIFTALAEKRPVRLTSVFNGAFSYVLRFGIPLLNTKEQSIAFYDGKADWKIDFTSLEDTAAFTAEAALDDTAPRYLRIAGFRVSPEDLVRLSGKIFGTPFQLQNQGSLEQFSETIQKVRTAHPEGEQELYPAWQQMQYLYSMFAAHHDQLDNARYPGLNWQNAEETLRSSHI
ncbi:NmrA family NAD(P)-binding protein [Chryseobacterium fluminis]|uniref:NmrA family NAD(P)-binding protein n=1 Tax=Chryseobacterium fluminis TaxID=2983606 RepID=UPI002256FD4E|nr:NmrA family NAD(P)-binding protein [Chryseobacterium sp. MMS21-Ot14]UZT99163.1 NmrA family NAD(P)-binding protein [Chryseobacterium sp. MMS21-Ot14]